MGYFGPFFGPSGGTPTAVPDGPSTAPSRLAVGYCTDEDLALAAGDDFGALAARSLKLAEGSDGVFAPGRPWQVDSASVDFAAQGVAPRGVLLLFEPVARFGRIAAGESLAVQAAAGASCYLRRLGRDPGQGQPPAPAAGLADVRFACFTFNPQIDEASFKANRLCGIDPTSPGRAPADLTDLRELRRYTVLSVLKWAYTMAVKGNEPSEFTAKLGLVSAELAEVAGRLQVRWGAGGKAERPTGPFTARIRRG